MDKNTITGLILMGLIFVGYVWYSSDQAAEYEAAQQKIKQEQMLQAAEEALAEAEAAAVADSVALSVDSLQLQPVEVNQDVITYGATLASRKGIEAETVTLENDVLSVELTTQGGMMHKVTLEEYTKYSDGERNEQVVLFEPESANFSTTFALKNVAEPVETSLFVFENKGVEQGDGFQKVTFSLPLSADAALQYVYTLYDKKDAARDYLLDFDIQLINADAVMAKQESIALAWANRTYQNERGFANENNYTTIAYRLADEDDVEELDISTSKESEKLDEEPVNWVSFKQQFFSQTFIAHDNFDSADLSYNTAKEGSGFMKEFSATMTLPYSGQNEYKLSMYCGPNKFAILKDVEVRADEDIYLEKVIPLGGWIIGWFNRWIIIPVMDFLSGHIASFGIIILILTLLVKALILPLTYKSYLSTAKMRVIKPEMDALNEKYPRKEDAMKKQQAMMELYKKAGVNPLGGCLPMLIQLPILWALFRFFPASIELRGESFLWAHDLSSYDSVLQLPFTIPWYGDHVSLFALLMSLALMGFSYFSYKQTGAAQPQGGVMKFMMVYFMPFMMLMWFNSYSSGLCYYYLVSQVLTMIIMFSMRRFVDDKKIRAIMERTAAKKHNGKKSKFQLRYEELMRQQELMQQQQQKGRR